MDNNNLLDKAFTFFRTAVKKYEEGDIEGALSDIKWGYDAVMENESDSLDAPSEDEVLGENRNFGKIYKVIEENAEKLYKTKSGRVTLGKIAGLIRGNKVLKEQFDVYTTLSSMSSDVDVDNYLYEAMQLLPVLTKNELKENNMKLAKIVMDGGLDLNVFISNDENKLYEAIEYILSNKKSIRNVDRFQLAESTIKNHISENIANRNEERINEDLNTVYENKIDAIERKYNSEFNDDEIVFLRKMMNEGTDRRKFFNEYKNALTKKINRLVNESKESDRDAWKNVLESVNKMSDNDELIIENLAKMIEIENKIDN